MRFELPATRTLEFTGRTVPVLSCGADKRSFTVALTVKANGEKLFFQMLWTAPRMKLCGKKKRLELMKQTTSWRTSLIRTASRKTSRQDNNNKHNSSFQSYPSSFQNYKIYKSQQTQQLFSELPQFFSELQNL